MSLLNNEVLRCVRHSLNYGDDKMVAVFALGERDVTEAEVADWLREDEDAALIECPDAVLASFLNGLIVDRRGPKEGPTPKPESKLTNNVILTKLKIAFAFSGDDVMEALNLVGHYRSKHELSALFRKPEHKHHRKCPDDVLLDFLRGLQMKLRPESTANESTASESKPGI